MITMLKRADAPMIPASHTAIAARPYVRRARPLNFAHRGGALPAPENTLPAFAHAAWLGADILECAVRRTRCGTVGVFHDGHWPTTNKRGRPSGCALAVAQALDAASASRHVVGIFSLAHAREDDADFARRADSPALTCAWILM
jgi:glycerophosphoryl diester phosphodiesterase